MAKFTKFKDSQSWHIGWYPTHKNDWQLSLQHIGDMAINLDIMLNAPPILANSSTTFSF